MRKQKGNIVIEMALISGVILVFLLMILAGVGLFMDWRCAELGERSGMFSEFHVIGGCYVQTESGRMVPYERWRVIE